MIHYIEPRPNDNAKILLALIDDVIYQYRAVR